MNINGIEVSVKGVDNVSEQEIINYIDYIHGQTSEELERLEISAAQNGSVALDYTLRPPKFERIRRITGYLVGTIDRWNNAKRAEEHDGTGEHTPGIDAADADVDANGGQSNEPTVSHKSNHPF